MIGCRFQVNYVYCWHGLPAYWAGIMPNSPEVRLNCPQVYYSDLHVLAMMVWNLNICTYIHIMHHHSSIREPVHVVGGIELLLLGMYMLQQSSEMYFGTADH